jgi:hypothetical protein
VVISGDGQTVISNSSQMFVGFYTLVTGFGANCKGDNCTLFVNSQSTLTSTASFGVADHARVIATDFSQIVVERGDLVIANGSLLSIMSGSRLTVNGAAVIVKTSAISSISGIVSIGGSVVCLGVNNGMYIEKGSQLRVGGSISLATGSAIVLSESLLSADFGNITTDSSSAIYLFNNSLLSGTGLLDATVYSQNSSTSFSLFHISPIAFLTILFATKPSEDPSSLISSSRHSTSPRQAQL